MGELWTKRDRPAGNDNGQFYKEVSALERRRGVNVDPKTGMSLSLSRYNAVYLRLLGLAVFQLFAYSLGATEKLDHLVPNDGIIKSAYQDLLRRKLYLTPAEYLRIAVLPSTGSLGEIVYSLRSDKQTANEAILTWTHAESNLWAEASDANGALTIDPRAKISRLDISIPKSLAISISKAIAKKIDNSRKWVGTGAIIVDGTDVLFSIMKDNGREKQAVLMAGSSGGTVKALVRFLEVLDRYCKAKRTDRDRLLKELGAVVVDLENT